MTPIALDAIPVSVKAWALLALAAFVTLFLVQENGVLLSAHGGMWLHELTHDARHALGVPCH